MDSIIRHGGDEEGVRDSQNVENVQLSGVNNKEIV